MTLETHLKGILAAELSFLKTFPNGVHDCPVCSLNLDRYHNAALNILTLGLRDLVNSAELARVPDCDLEQIACGDLTATLSGRLKASQIYEAGSSAPLGAREEVTEHRNT